MEDIVRYMRDSEFVEKLMKAYSEGHSDGCQDVEEDSIVSWNVSILL